ncbi:MAG: cytochrome d ubiquinol oxidase subunit II [Deltaproteobacteria bacterium]|nr:cytochrome d ubiquinol oxidase subunit II [Deltaproteobacteria bacterium]
MSSLQIIWFVLIFVLLTGYAVLDGFDLGVGIWHLFTKNKRERGLFIRAIGPYWDGNEVWLLTGGGALFAAFPPVYATVFSGFYLAMILVVLSLIFRASAIEFRDKIQNEKWITVWDIAFAVGSILPSILFGVALGNVVRGLPLDQGGNYMLGFFALLNPYALFIGITGFFMLMVHGAAYIFFKTTGELKQRARTWIIKSWMIYLPLHLTAVIWTMLDAGYYSAALSGTGALLAVVFVVLIRAALAGKGDGAVFVMSSLSIVFNMIFVAFSLFPNLVNGLYEKNLGLNIYTSSSSQETLTVMLIIAGIGMPIVLLYTGYIYRTFAGKVE